MFRWEKSVPIFCCVCFIKSRLLGVCPFWLEKKSILQRWDLWESSNFPFSLHVRFVLRKGRVVLSAVCLQTGISFGSLRDWLWPSVPWPQNSRIQAANTCKRELSRGFLCLFCSGYCSRPDLRNAKATKEIGNGADWCQEEEVFILTCSIGLPHCLPPSVCNMCSALDSHPCLGGCGSCFWISQAGDSVAAVLSAPGCWGGWHRKGRKPASGQKQWERAA